MLEDYFEEKEEEEQQQQQPQLQASAEVTITNSGQQNYQPTCRQCFSRGQRKGVVYKCARCDVGLCVVPCCAEYHTKINL